MDGDLTKLIYGAIGGGLVTLIWNTIDRYWVGIRFTESIEAKKKLRFYAKPLWLECHYLQERLDHIIKRVQESNAGTKAALTITPKDASSVEWFTKDGHYVTSTAYMVAAVCCWIRLFQRDVVFLNFGKSATANFFNLIEQFKHSLGDRPSILWYYYLNGIGDYLTQDGKNMPMSVAEFSRRLFEDKLFEGYYDQLFQFLNQIGSGEHLAVLQRTTRTLHEIKIFLEGNGAVPQILIHCDLRSV